MVLECRHIKLSGGKCGSPALRGKPYCYFHSRMKEHAKRLHRKYPSNGIMDLAGIKRRNPKKTGI